MKIFHIIIRIIIVIICIYMFYSCFVYHDITHLSEDELKWINQYKDGDSILFISSKGRTDTLIAREPTIHNSKDIFYFSEGFGPNYQAYAVNGFVIKGCRYELDGRMRIDKYTGWDTIRPGAHIGGLFSLTHERTFDEETEAYVVINDLYLFPSRDFEYGDMILNNCIVFDKTNSRYSKYWNDSTKIIKRFAYNKEYGLIYYEMNDGEEFFRKDLLNEN